MHYTTIAAELLDRSSIKQSFSAWDSYKGVNTIISLSNAQGLLLCALLQLCRVPDLCLPADGSTRAHQSLRWAKVAGEWLESYKQIARRLCDRWQAPEAQERSTGQKCIALCCSTFTIATGVSASCRRASTA